MAEGEWLIRRVEHTRDYTPIANAVLRNAAVTFRARGLLGYLLSLPRDWRTSTERIARNDTPEGRDAVRTAMSELEVNGYVARRKERDPGSGKVRTVVLVDEAGTLNDQVTPTTGNQAPDNQGPVDQAPDSQAPNKVTTRNDQNPTGSDRAQAPTLELVTANDPPAEPVRERRRDLLWEAVVEVCGYDPARITPSARGAINRALGDLRGVAATPEEVVARAAVYPILFPGASLTAPALAKHWAQLDPALLPASKRAKVNPSQDVLHRLAMEGDR